LVSRNRRFLALGALPLALSAGLAVAGLFNPLLWMGVPHTFLLGLVALFYIWRTNPRPRKRDVHASVDETAVWVDTEPLVHRADLEAGHILPNPDGDVVRLVARGLKPNVELEVPTIAEGRRLLEGLGLDASQVMASFRATSLLLAQRWKMGVAVFAAVAAGLALSAAAASFGMTPVLPMLVVASTLAVALLAPTRVQVGSDGVHIRWLHHKRFVPLADVDHVRIGRVGMGQHAQITVELDLVDGETIAVPVGPPRWHEDKARILAQRIVDACGSHGSSSVELSGLIQRRGRDMVTWVRALLAAGSGASATHRAAPANRERLLRIVEDPSSQSTDRAAASVALHAGLEPDERTRIRIAQQATADPGLRVVLDAAIDEAAAEEELALALEAVKDAD